MTDTSPGAPGPPPTRDSRSLRALAMMVAAGVVILVAAATWLLSNDEAQSVTDTPQAALQDAPTLQELAAEADSPSTDDVAPDFSVPTAEGGAFTLSKHLAEDGRPVILNLWASWCFPCREEMPEIDAFAKANPNIAVVGVAVQDDVVSAERFAAEIGVAYIIGFDEKDAVNTAYRPLGLPATFFIASDGTIAKRHFGLVTPESLAEDVATYFG